MDREGSTTDSFRACLDVFAAVALSLLLVVVLFFSRETEVDHSWRAAVDKVDSAPKS